MRIPRGAVTVALVIATSAAGGAFLARATCRWTEIAALRGHSAEAAAVALSPDGKLAASAGADGRAFVWDLGAARELHALEGRSRVPTCVTFSPDGKAVIMGHADAPAAVWRFASGGEVTGMAPGSAGAVLVALSYDGRRAATADTEGVIRVWDAGTGVLASEPPDGHARARGACALMFSPSGRAVMAFPSWGSASAQDAATGENLLALGQSSFGSSWDFAFGGRSAGCFDSEYELRASDGKGWSEDFPAPLAVTLLAEGPPRPQGTPRSPSAAVERKPFIALGEGKRRAVVGLGNGIVAVIRPRQAWDWVRLWQLPAAVALLAVLVAWLVLARRLQEPATAPVEPPVRVTGDPLAPRAVRILAYLVTAEGAIEVVALLGSIAFSFPQISIGLLNLWAGPGLLRLDRGWRKLVLFEAWLGLVGAGLLAGMVADGSQPLTFRPFGTPMAWAPAWAVWLVVAAAMPLLLWARHVLVRPDVRAMFERGAPAPQPAPAEGEV